MTTKAPVKKNNTLRHLRELSRFRDILVHTVCKLLSAEESVDLHPHLILEMRFLSPFKTLVVWHTPHSEATPPTSPITEARFYQVRRAANLLSYQLHRFKLGDRLYLRRVWDLTELPPAQELHQQEYFVTPPR